MYPYGTVRWISACSSGTRMHELVYNSPLLTLDRMIPIDADDEQGKTSQSDAYEMFVLASSEVQQRQTGA